MSKQVKVFDLNSPSWRIWCAPGFIHKLPCHDYRVIFVMNARKTVVSVKNSLWKMKINQNLKLCFPTGKTIYTVLILILLNIIESSAELIINKCFNPFLCKRLSKEQNLEKRPPKKKKVQELVRWNKANFINKGLNTIISMHVKV